MMDDHRLMYNEISGFFTRFPYGGMSRQVGYSPSKAHAIYLNNKVAELLEVDSTIETSGSVSGKALAELDKRAKEVADSLRARAAWENRHVGKVREKIKAKVKKSKKDSDDDVRVLQ